MTSYLYRLSLNILVSRVKKNAPNGAPDMPQAANVRRRTEVLRILKQLFILFTTYNSLINLLETAFLTAFKKSAFTTLI